MVIFSIKSTFDFLEGGRSDLFTKKLIWNQCHKGRLLCFGSLVGQSDDYGPTQEKGFSPSQYVSSV